MSFVILVLNAVNVPMFNGHRSLFRLTSVRPLSV